MLSVLAQWWIGNQDINSIEVSTENWRFLKKLKTSSPHASLTGYVYDWFGCPESGQRFHQMSVNAFSKVSLLNSWFHHRREWKSFRSSCCCLRSDVSPEKRRQNTAHDSLCWSSFSDDEEGIPAANSPVVVCPLACLTSSTSLGFSHYWLDKDHRQQPSRLLTVVKEACKGWPRFTSWMLLFWTTLLSSTVPSSLRLPSNVLRIYKKTWNGRSFTSVLLNLRSMIRHWIRCS